MPAVFQRHCVNPRIWIRKVRQAHRAPRFAVVLRTNFKNAVLPGAANRLLICRSKSQNGRLDGRNRSAGMTGRSFATSRRDRLSFKCAASHRLLCCGAKISLRAVESVCSDRTKHAISDAAVSPRFPPSSDASACPTTQTDSTHFVKGAVAALRLKQTGFQHGYRIADDSTPFATSLGPTSRHSHSA